LLATLGVVNLLETINVCACQAYPVKIIRPELL
jgi:hypothetical protein